MNQKNDEINTEEEELNELPGYIQSIINDFYTFDKKENQDNKEKKQLKNSPNLDIDEDDKEIKSDNLISNEDDNIFENNKNIEYDFNKEDLENDMDYENIFNSKNDFFNKKTNDDENRRLMRYGNL